MSQDPKLLASEISADLAPSDFPPHLGTVPDDELFLLHARLVGETKDLRSSIKEIEKNSRGPTEDLGRIRAILSLKYTKVEKIEKEIGRRDPSRLPSDKDLRKLPRAELHALMMSLSDELGVQKNHMRELEKIRERSPVQLAKLRRLDDARQRRLSERSRLSLEFSRRKEANVDPSKTIFMVRRAPMAAAELEGYLAATHKEHPKWYPQNIIAMGDHLLVVWRTTEPLYDGDPPDEEETPT